MGKKKKKKKKKMPILIAEEVQMKVFVT